MTINTSPSSAAVGIELRDLQGKLKRLVDDQVAMNDRRAGIQERIGDLVIDSDTPEKVIAKMGAELAAIDGQAAVVVRVISDIDQRIEAKKREVFEAERREARVKCADIDATIDAELDRFIPVLGDLIEFAKRIRDLRMGMSEMSGAYAIHSRHSNTSISVDKLELIYIPLAADAKAARAQLPDVPLDSPMQGIKIAVGRVASAVKRTLADRDDTDEWTPAL